MLYHDTIYGPAEIAEPVLLDLIASDAMQRLKGVLQHGITALIGITAPTSRFEHSVGTMLLTRRLGAGLEEQIAALLHDVSHTAFSHVIDFAFEGRDGQSYHEEKKAEYLAASDLPARLAAHGYAWRDFLDETAFPILEQPAPALCADRLDYFLRGCIPLRLATPDAIRRALDGLTLIDRRIAMRDRAAARWLAYTYIESDRTSWSDPREVGLYELTARAIKAALDSGLIGEADFWSTDAALWRRLGETEDPALKALLALISPDTRFVLDEDAPSFRVRAKRRTVDPALAADGGAVPLSALDREFARYRNAYFGDGHLALPLKIVAPANL